MPLTEGAITRTKHMSHDTAATQRDMANTALGGTLREGQMTGETREMQGNNTAHAGDTAENAMQPWWGHTRGNYWYREQQKLRGLVSRRESGAPTTTTQYCKQPERKQRHQVVMNEKRKVGTARHRGSELKRRGQAAVRPRTTQRGGDSER